MRVRILAECLCCDMARSEDRTNMRSRCRVPRGTARDVVRTDMDEPCPLLGADPCHCLHRVRVDGDRSGVLRVVHPGVGRAIDENVEVEAGKTLHPC